MSRDWGDKPPGLRDTLRAANLNGGHWCFSLIGFLLVGGVMALLWGALAVGAAFLPLGLLGTLIVVAVGRRRVWRGDLDAWDAERAEAREAWRARSRRQKLVTVAGVVLVAALAIGFRLFLEYLEHI